MAVPLDANQQFPFVEPPRLAIYAPAPGSMPIREKLPNRRKNLTQKVRVGRQRQRVYYTFGLYDDGRPGELFIDVAKAGQALRTWASEAGMMFSMALQHHTPLETI